MSFYSPNNNYNDWYQPIDPRENVYTAGYGWAPKPPYIIELQMISRSAAAVVLCLIGYMFVNSYVYHAMISFFGFAVPFEIYTRIAGAADELSLIVAQIVSLLLPFSLYAMYVRIPLRCALPMRRVSAGLLFSAVSVCLAATVLGGCCADSAYALFDAMGLRFYDSLSDMPRGMTEMVLYCVNVVFLAPVLEEIAFRGFLMQSLRRFGDSFALVVSAILFGMLHGSPVSIVYAVLMGLVMGYFVLFTGSLHTAMVVHFINNLLAVVFTALSERFPDAAYLISIGIDTIYLILGICAVIWLSRRYENIFSLKSSRTINRGGAKIKQFFLSMPFIIFALIILYRAWGTLIW